jgi:peptidoglycan/xylan/chitin deacetylase (PgdA/CDA1 family)
MKPPKYLARCRAAGVVRTQGRAPAFRFATIVIAAICILAAGAARARAEDLDRFGSAATILVYHRFGATASDAMSITTESFISQLDYMQAHGYQVVPLRQVAAFAAGKDSIPARAVAITVDDGHRSVFTEMKPIVERRRIPVTLFIYPSAISNAPYAMTWAQLGALKATGLFDIESHTYWHPNFKIERKRLGPRQFDDFARDQFIKARVAIDRHLGLLPDQLAWPFGIYDDDLIRIARSCGYVAGFTIERRPVRRGENVMALPRYLVTAAMKGREFEAVLHRGTSGHNFGE